MISVDEALSLIRGSASRLPIERIPVGAAYGRILARDVAAAISQPPFRASAMDGYAARFDDAREGATLRVIGESAAGAPFKGVVGRGEAVRIFTGGVVPEGADHVVIQEDVQGGKDGKVVIAAAQKQWANVRERGIDFQASAVLKRAGERLGAIDLALIAAANVADVDVLERPRVAYFDNGDELVEPGDALADGQIIGSNRFAFGPLIAEWGASPLYLGRAADERKAITEKFERGRATHVVVAIGGASVGDHDHVGGAFADCGGDIVFSKVSVKPGKPTWFGHLGSTLVLGLPGNPASAIVCAILFLRPLIAAMIGETQGERFVKAGLASALDANGPRESYLRAAMSVDTSARLSVKAFVDQDSSLLSPLANGNCLIRRVARAPAAPAGAIVECVGYTPLHAGFP